MKPLSTTFLIALSFCAFSCGSGGSDATASASGGDPLARMTAFVTDFRARPEHTDNAVRVQHLLVGFQGSVRGKAIQRTRDEAELLAAELFARALDGEDFDALVREYTDDAHPGIYLMKVELGPNDRVPDVFPRGQMVAAFGDTGWRLQVGEIGVATHHPEKSPFGWHIVKRIE